MAPVNRKPPPLGAYDPPGGPLDLLHSDDDLLVVGKPAGLLSVPGRDPAHADCLLARVQAADPAALLIHRLDMDTSGLMIFARNRAAQRHLGLQFERRHVAKTYLARVGGDVAGRAGRIDMALRADWPNRPLQMVDPVAGRPAVTRWQVLARAPGETRLALHPLTGRSHQLRVHCAAIGHPILGDRFYNGAPAPRLMLHAAALTLHHPTGGARVTFSAPAPF